MVVTTCSLTRAYALADDMVVALMDKAPELQRVLTIIDEWDAASAKTQLITVGSVGDVQRAVDGLPKEL